MTTRPLVSIITPTWQRAELLAGCIENVRIQTYRPLEHVIVSDGSDGPTAQVAIAALDCVEVRPEHAVAVRFTALGRNWSTFLTDAYAAAPITVGMLMASGEYQMWLADDERMDPDHVEALVSALEAAGADFAYSKAHLYWAGAAPEASWVIGTDPPKLGQITNVLYRTDLLKRGLYAFGDDRASDWATIARWMAHGATWAFVDRCTLTHRVDR